MFNRLASAASMYHCTYSIHPVHSEIHQRPHLTAWSPADPVLSERSTKLFYDQIKVGHLQKPND